MQSRSAVKKRSVCLCGKETSVSLEDEFWAELKRLAAQRPLARVIEEIDLQRTTRNLSSAIRLYVLERK
jgi:predicted DNA-binding ribbon-helix-helix protein